MKITTLAAVAVVALLIVGVLFSLNFGLTPKSHVEITSITSTGTSSGSSYGVVNVLFVLNLTNTGAGNVDNLTVTFITNRTIENNRQLICTNSISPSDHVTKFEMGQPCLLGDLKAKETKDFMFCWAVGFDFDAPALTATLKSNEAIVDQATITIPPIPKVKITNFTCLGVWHGTRLGGLLDLFSLSYTNLGAADVENLTVTLNTSRTNEKDTDPQYPTLNPDYNPYYFLDEIINGETHRLESVKESETKTFEKSYWDVGFLLIEPFALTATLKSDETILDQATIIIPISRERSYAKLPLSVVGERLDNSTLPHPDALYIKISYTNFQPYTLYDCEITVKYLENDSNYRIFEFSESQIEPLQEKNRIFSVDSLGSNIYGNPNAFICVGYGYLGR